MKVQRVVTAEVMQWTKSNHIEFVTWLSKVGIDWQYSPDYNHFYVGRVGGAEWEDTVLINNFLLVEPSQLDNPTLVVYTERQWERQQDWSLV